jgi:hypothetical protein
VSRKEAQPERKQERVQPLFLQAASSDQDALGLLQHHDDVLFQAFLVRRERR